MGLGPNAGPTGPVEGPAADGRGRPGQAGCVGDPAAEAVTAWTPSCSIRISGVFRTLPDFATLLVGMAQIAVRPPSTGTVAPVT